MQKTGGRIFFHELAGQAEAFLDGAPVGTKSTAHPGKLSINLPPCSQKLTLSVLILADAAPAGLSKPVEILNPA